MDDNLCIMPECPYCPACPFGLVVYPDWVETYDDACDCVNEWRCLLTQEQYDKYMAEHPDEMRDGDTSE